MGSIEVYDMKREKWIPYVPDFDKWYQHFKDLSEGYFKPDHMGRYIVGSGRRNRKLKEIVVQQQQKEIEFQQQQRPVVKQVTPVAQAIEIAKSEIERKQKENDNDSMHTNVVGGQQQRKKYQNKPPVDWNSFRY